MIFAIGGSVDSENAATLGARLQDEIEAGAGHLVLDLHGVESMNLDGLWELMTALKRARRLGGDLRLAQPADPARAAIEAAGLNEIFRIYETLAEAAASYRDARQ